VKIPNAAPPERLVRRWSFNAAGFRRHAAAGLLVGIAICVAACGSATDMEALLLKQPSGAYYLDGRLLLEYEGGPQPTILEAAWRVDDLEPGAHNFRMAVLEPVELPDAELRSMRKDGQLVKLEGRGRWRAVVNELLEQFAPPDPATATVVTIQHTDIALSRDSAGRMHVHRLKDAPREVPIGRRITEQAFSARANDYLRATLSVDTGPAGPVLFAVGDDELGGTFVLFDFAHRQSVFIAHTPSGSPIVEHVDFSLRLIDAMTVRSHVLSALRNPVTMANRLVWLAGHSGAAALPRGVSAKSQAPPVGDAAPMDLDEWEAILDATIGPDQYRGSMNLLVDGEAFFESLIQAIQEAEHSIDIRLYIFSRDDYALRIADLLKHRSREVKIRVLVDRLGTLAAGFAPPGSAYHSQSQPQTSIVEYLRKDSKIDVRVVNNPWFTSDHTKVIVIDRRVAYVGGMNIGREYRYEWHDMMVEVTGPIVGRLAKDFQKRWSHTGMGGDLAFGLASMRKEKYLGPADDPELMVIRPVYTRTGDAQILRAQLAAIANARSRIYIQQPYVSDDALIAALVRARQRGVDVRFILPSRSDSGFMDSANLITARALINNGVRVFVYPGMTHVKAAIYDGWAIVGSANFDKLSLRINQETNLATSDPRFVDRLARELFEVDFARSEEWSRAGPVGWRDYVSKVIAEQL
jgi:cardiolipin synthase A/B